MQAFELTYGAVCQGGEDPDQPKVNQDAFFVADAGPAWVQAAVLDGHGKKGQLVSGAIQASLSGLVIEELARCAPEEALANAFVRADGALLATIGSTPARASGAACVAALIRRPSNGAGWEVVVANAGDCRAVLGRKVGEVWQAEALSRACTCRIPAEAARVQAAGGRLSDDGLIVWAGPIGVAMSRALGDLALRPFGVICTPEVRRLRGEEAETPCFLLLMSDGISDVVSDSEIVDITGRCWAETKSPQKATEVLVATARERWRAGLPLEVRIDDTTAVMVPIVT